MATTTFIIQQLQRLITAGIDLCYEYIYLLSILWSLTIVFWTSWILYRHICDKHALTLAKQLHGNKSKTNIRRMGILSELWQIMYETNNSPIIHAFEHGPNSGYHLLTEFWLSFSKKYINFRSVPIKVNNRWFWKELDVNNSKEFNIEDHVKYIELESINNNTELALTKFVSDLNMNKPFDKDKPYWQAYYVCFKDNKDVAYGYGRFHHALGDGVLINKIFQLEHNALWAKNTKNTESTKDITEKIAVSPKNKSTKKKKNKKSVGMIIWNLIKYLPFSIMDLASLFWIESAPLNCGIHCDYFGKDTYEYNIKRKFNIGISNKFSLTKIKQKCKQINNEFTVNDFVMTIFCQSVYQYIFKYVCNNDKDKYKKITDQYGDKLYLRFFTIFNMRSLIDNDIEKLSAKLAADVSENAISTVPIRLPCGDIEFRKRLEEVHDLFNKLKNGPTPIITSLIINIGQFLFGLKFINAILGKFSATKCTFLLSNLMGPKQPLLSGPDDHVLNVFNSTNPTHTPLSCGIMSYVDNITFSMVADVNSVKDPNQFMQCLNTVYDQIMDADNEQ